MSQSSADSIAAHLAQIPPEAVPHVAEAGFLEPDRLRPGDQVPQLTLTALSGEAEVTLGRPDAPRPTVLIFGSYT